MVPDLTLQAGCKRSHSALLVGPSSSGPPTFMFIEEAANESQNGQRNKVSQAGGNGCGDVVWVDPKLSSTNHYTDHQQSCREERKET